MTLRDDIILVMRDRGDMPTNEITKGLLRGYDMPLHKKNNYRKMVGCCLRKMESDGVVTKVGFTFSHYGKCNIWRLTDDLER